MKNNSQMQIIYSTFPSKGEAKRVLKILLEKKLVACGNIIDGVESMYEWNGVIETSNECVCILKTSSKNLVNVNEVFEKEHSYDTPCVIALDVSKINSKFESWIISSINEI